MRFFVEVILIMRGRTLERHTLAVHIKETKSVVTFHILQCRESKLAQVGR